MPWKIVKSVYEATDATTFHDDELIAIERSLRATMGNPHNEFNPAWRAWHKVRALAEVCDGSDDPMSILPVGAPSDPRLRDGE